MAVEDPLVALVARHAPTDGAHETGLDGVRLFRASRPVSRLPGVYPRSVCVVVQGSKRAFIGGDMLVYDARHYLCATMPIPVEADVPEASAAKPLLGLQIGFDSRTALETVVQYEAAQALPAAPAESARGLFVATWDDAFTDALSRLLSLLDDRTALRILGEGRLRELMFAILRGKFGSALLHAVNRDPFAAVVRHIRENLHTPLVIDDLARRAGMSRASFDRSFRETTTYSPLQFIKSLRLNDAAMLIVGGVNVGEAADRVGYTSASQFSREFRRLYGASPREWAKGVQDSADATAV